MPLVRILADISRERDRQEAMKAQGRFAFTCADEGMTDSDRFAVLSEEFGEAVEEWDTLARTLGIGMGRTAREVLTQDGRRLARDTVGTLAALRKELVQVAAVAAAWIERIDRVDTSPAPE